VPRLDGKIAVITGGGSGIGRAFCRRFSREGANVVVADLDGTSAQVVASAIAAEGGGARAATVNVTARAEVDAMISEVLREFGQIDVLINNAGIYPVVPFWEITDDEWDRVINVNLKGTFLCSQVVARKMMERKAGKIINISSGTFMVGAPLCAHYVAAKAGIIGLTRAMARELGPYGINVNGIAPGLTMTDTALATRTEDEFGASRRTRCISRDEYPEDLVGAAVFLASPDSDFITGQTLAVEGGRAFW